MMPSPPVKEGETWKLKVECFGDKGDGISKINKYTIFIKKERLDEHNKVIPLDLQIGQEYDVKITKVLGQFAFAEVVI